MRVAEILLELGNARYPYQQTGPGTWTAQLPSGKELAVEFEIETRFSPAGGNRRAKNLNISFFVNDDYRISGEGDQFRVFATVMQVLANELPRAIQPDVKFVDFTADYDEPSRIALYTRAAPRIDRILRTISDQWQFEKINYGQSIRFVWHLPKDPN